MGCFETGALVIASAVPSCAILDHSSALSDLHEQRLVIYPLLEILLLVLCATICGMDDFVETKTRPIIIGIEQIYVCVMPIRLAHSPAT